MKTHYFTFGQEHTHRLPNITLDKNIVIKITDENPRAVMFELFQDKWAFEYTDLQSVNIQYFPRGIFDLQTGKVITGTFE